VGIATWILIRANFAQFARGYRFEVARASMYQSV